MRILKICIFAIFMLPPPPESAAEIVLLKNGEKLEGNIVISYNKGILFREGTGTPGHYYPYDQISRISTKDDMLYYLMPRTEKVVKKPAFRLFPLTRMLLPSNKLTAADPHLRLPRGESVEVRCAGAEDAVTILLEGGAKVKLLGLDPPPKSAGTKKAKMAREYADSLVKGKQALLFPGPQGTAEPSHAEAYVVVDNDLINGEIIQNGWARAAAHGVPHPYAEAFASLQKFAKNLSRGMWAGPPPRSL
ncbi:MAG: thermonuclease family protein [Candidatus Aureabacteria bacterium]|nr:thermonuclease family protein [Candidatus Auribacterota bacterium]